MNHVGSGYDVPENVGNETMIEVTAKVVRGPVYLAGESVECYITFSNTPEPVLKRSQSNR
jgi:hypothetical protein